MKNITLIFLLFYSVFVKAQIYSGNSVRGTTCVMKINKDSTIIFTAVIGKTAYLEYFGKIRKISGKIYEVNWESNFAQYMMESTDDRGEGYFDIIIDPLLDFSKDIGHLKISYAGKDTTFTAPPKRYYHFYYDKKVYNKNSIVKIKTNHKNAITEEPLIVHMPFGLATGFSKHHHNEVFRILWSQNEITCLSDLPLETGRFKLKKVQ